MEPHSAPRVGERYTQRDGERHMHRNAECNGGLRQQAPAAGRRSDAAGQHPGIAAGYPGIERHPSDLGQTTGRAGDDSRTDSFDMRYLMGVPYERPPCDNAAII
jgi:hypothetical protein